MMVDGATWVQVMPVVLTAVTPGGSDCGGVPLKPAELLEHLTLARRADVLPFAPTVNPAEVYYGANVRRSCDRRCRLPVDGAGYSSRW